MTLTIGRTSGLRPTRARPTYDGAGVLVEGVYFASSTNELRAVRQQLLGLQDNDDEEVVPVVWATDSTLDGFYRPSSVRVDVLGPTATATKLKFSVRLDGLAGYASPWFEVTTSSVVRTNSHGITTPTGVIYTRLNVGNGGYDLRRLPGTTGGIARRASGSSYSTEVGTGPAPLALGSMTYQVSPARYYEDACKVEVLYGSTWYPVVGAQIPESRRWRISNGLVRLTSANGATEGTIEVWDNGAAAWESTSIVHRTASAAVSIGLGLTGIAGEQPPLRILRNSPEAVAVRVHGYNSADMTYAVRRGAMHVEAVYTSMSANTMGVGFASATACTAITGGVRQTANDANGNRLVLGMVAAFTPNLGAGTIYPSSSVAETRSMFFGVELAGSSAVAGNTAADLVDQFMAAPSWRQRVVVQ